MHIDVIPNRGSPPAILLRESYREDCKTKKRTLTNLSDWPAERIEQFRAVLRRSAVAPSEAVEIIRALPNGHVLAALERAQLLDLEVAWALASWLERRQQLSGYAWNLFHVSRTNGPGDGLHVASAANHVRVALMLPAKAGHHPSILQERHIGPGGRRAGACRNTEARHARRGFSRTFCSLAVGTSSRNPSNRQAHNIGD
jgi:hypothetical protein